MVMQRHTYADDGVGSIPAIPKSRNVFLCSSMSSLIIIFNVKNNSQINDARLIQFDCQQAESGVDRNRDSGELQISRKSTHFGWQF